MRSRTWLLAAAVCFADAAATHGAGEGVLEFLAEEAQVVTASRRPQPEQDSPVVIDVITREEIEASGAVHLWDLLRFQPGMDVVDGTSTLGNRAIVSIRGSPRETIRELLVLIDGRSVYSLADAAVYWDTLPVQLQDIERIEIVRGPNAALYGSNAAIGVIQILTRKPGSKTDAGLAGVGGSQDTWHGSAYVEQGGPRLGARLSYTRRSEAGWPAVSGSESNDALRSDQVDLRAHSNLGLDTELELWAGGAWQDLQVPHELDPRWDFQKHYAALRLERSQGPGNSLEATVSFQHSLQVGAPFFQGPIDLRERQLDAEVLKRLAWDGDRFETTAGLSYRHLEVRSERYFPFEPEQHSHIARGFLHQSVRIAERFLLVGGLALEDSGTGGTEPAYQLSALWHATPDHTFRLVHALAPNIPAIADTRRVFQPNPNVLVFGNPDLEAEHMRLFEASYHGAWWQRRLQVAGTVYYMKTDDRGILVLEPGPPPRRASPQSINESEHRGAELELQWHPAQGRRFWLNYTYVKIEDRLEDPLFIGNTPLHKLNLGGTARLGRRVSISARAGYKDAHPIRSLTRMQSLDIPAGWRLDARLAYRPVSQLELFVSGTNLQERGHLEYPDGLEIRRSFYAGLAWKLSGDEP